jgi:hypothetical protein
MQAFQSRPQDACCVGRLRRVVSDGAVLVLTRGIADCLGWISIGEAWLYSSYCNASLVGLVVREGRGRSSEGLI